ncbi:MAG TPA: DNA polymerase III subunit chi [Aestuariivirga sp.]
MAEIMFYHLEHKPWEQVLPGQLSKALQRGWRCVVQIGKEDRVDEVSELLWKSEADAFLAHGAKADGKAGKQPIWLTAETDNPNNATVRFFIEGAVVGDVSGLTRAAILFDGRDEIAVTAARADWKRLKAEGHQISYWQQDENYRWQNKSKAGD